MMSPVRRTPRQPRSTSTVEQILTAASTLLAEKPLDDITTTLIAQQAGLSVGALYRFFPDKQSILDAIALARMDDFQSSLTLTAAKALLSDGPSFLSQIIDSYIDFLDRHPDFRALALGRHISPAARAAQALPAAGPASLVRSFLLRRLGAAGNLDLKLRIAIETGERLIALAYAEPSPEARALVLAEMKTLLASYLFPR